MKAQADVIATRLFRACEAPNLRACQSIAAPILGAWRVQYGYNDMLGYWIRFEAADNDALEFMYRFFDQWMSREQMLDGLLFTSHEWGFTRQDLVGCLLSVDAQAGMKLPK